MSDEPKAEPKAGKEELINCMFRIAGALEDLVDEVERVATLLQQCSVRDNSNGERRFLRVISIQD